MKRQSWKKPFNTEGSSPTSHTRRPSSNVIKRWRLEVHQMHKLSVNIRDRNEELYDSTSV